MSLIVSYFVNHIYFTDFFSSAMLTFLGSLGWYLKIGGQIFYSLDCQTHMNKDLRIGNFRSNRITNRIGSYDSNQIESGCSRLRVQCRLNEVIIIITDEQRRARCADSPGSSNIIARSLLQC